MKRDSLRGQLRTNQCLADYTTWRVGGFAKAMYQPLYISDLSGFLKSLPQSEPLLWLGLGSNSLIHDQGFSGTVVLTQGGLDGLSLLDPCTIRVEAGVSCAQMARFCSRNSLVGGEFWAGIPGTMGGALRMNAGCSDQETWTHVIEVETMTRRGLVRQRSADEFNWTYRNVEGLAEDEWFISASCRLSPGDKASSLQHMKNLLAHRAATQPTGEFNCGSVFRNPENDFAARLIESCGLKGYTIGGAKISEKHANFIINYLGKSSARDIELLIEHIQNIVFQHTQVTLVREVHMIGGA